MKNLRSIVLFLVIAAGFGGLLWFGARHIVHKEGHGDAAEVKDAGSKDGQGGMKRRRPRSS